MAVFIRKYGLADALREFKPVQTSPGQFAFRTLPTFWSFGELCTVALTAQGEAAQIFIQSGCKVPTALVDFGKNARNVQRFAEQIQRVLTDALARERAEMSTERARFHETEARLSRLQAQHEAHFLFTRWPTCAHSSRPSRGRRARCSTR